MRVLNKKQKKMIDEWLKEVWDEGDTVHSINDMPVELQNELEKVNDHETIWQNIDRYINDKSLDHMYRR